MAAALPLLMEHGHATTTRQIADAAGIAEGTVFRVFDTKHDLIDAALDAVFDPAELLEALDGIDPDQPLRERMLDIATRLQTHFLAIFRLMSALGVTPAAGKHRGDQIHDWRKRASDQMIQLVAADREAMRVPPEQVVRVLRLLTFSGSHPHITEQHLLTPEEIVDVVLDGVLLKDPHAKEAAC